MQRRKPPTPVLAAASIAAGVFILLSLVLPATFWWFLLGVGLIVVGIHLRRRC